MNFFGKWIMGTAWVCAHARTVYASGCCSLWNPASGIQSPDSSVMERRGTPCSAWSVALSHGTGKDTGVGGRCPSSRVHQCAMSALLGKQGAWVT